MDSSNSFHVDDDFRPDYVILDVNARKITELPESALQGPIFPYVTREIAQNILDQLANLDEQVRLEAERNKLRALIGALRSPEQKE